MPIGAELFILACLLYLLYLLTRADPNWRRDDDRR